MRARDWHYPQTLFEERQLQGKTSRCGRWPVCGRAIAQDPESTMIGFRASINIALFVLLSGLIVACAKESRAPKASSAYSSQWSPDRFVDTGDLLSADQKMSVVGKLRSIEQRSAMQVAVFLIPTTGAALNPHQERRIQQSCFPRQTRLFAWLALVSSSRDLSSKAVSVKRPLRS